MDAVSLTSASDIAAQLRANLDAQHELKREEATLRQRLAEAEAAENAMALDDEEDEAAPQQPTPASIDWSGTFPWSAAVDTCLHSMFGFDQFRPLQREVINATLSGRDCFAILPTGAGKSLLFQLPGLLSGLPASRPSGGGGGGCSSSSSQQQQTKPGLTVVVSPLVSLMTDQVANLGARGVRAALLATDVTSKEEQTAIHQQIADPEASGLRFLYVTPERVAKSKLLLSRLQKAYLAGLLARIAIDECHCAAAQGHDFRPDYLQLGALRASFPSVPILALTATASDAVRVDVERTLGFDECNVVRFRGHFDRSNIRYDVRAKPQSDEALLDEMAAVCRSSYGVVATGLAAGSAFASSASIASAAAAGRRGDQNQLLTFRPAGLRFQRRDASDVTRPRPLLRCLRPCRVR